MKIYELSFVDEAVKDIFCAFEKAQNLVDSGKSIKTVVDFIFEKYSVGLFSVENLNKVRDCSEILCDGIEDMIHVKTMCTYAEVAKAAVDWNCGE